MNVELSLEKCCLQNLKNCQSPWSMVIAEAFSNFKSRLCKKQNKEINNFWIIGIRIFALLLTEPRAIECKEWIVN